MTPKANPPQMELALPKRRASIVEPSTDTSFVLNEQLKLVAIYGNAGLILGIDNEHSERLENCKNLTNQERIRLEEAIKQALGSESPTFESFLRLELTADAYGSVFCLTLAKVVQEDQSVCVKCTAEPIVPLSLSKPQERISDKTANKVLGWRFDPKRRNFKVSGSENPFGTENITLEEWLALVVGTDRPRTEVAFSRIIGGEIETVTLQYRLTLPTGAIRQVTTVAHKASEEQTEIAGIHFFDNDNYSLIEDLKLFSHLAMKVQLSILVYDKEGKISWCNNAFTQCTGYTLEEILGRDPHSLLKGPMTDLDSLKQIRERIQKGKAFHDELVQYKKNGAPYWVSVDGNPLIDDTGKASRFISFQTDITESKKTQSAILRNEIKFRSLFDTSIDALLLVSPKDGVIIEANGASIQLLDTHRLVGQRLDEIFPENKEINIDHLNELVDRHREGTPNESSELVTACNQVIPVEVTVSRTPIGDSMALFVTLRDVSEKRLLEEQLRHAQRMEAVGRLAGGIAHDFNNLLAGQRGFCELLCNSRELSKKDHVYANEVLKITDRASKLTSRLLSFSRGRSEKPVVANLNTAIENMMPMLSRILKNDVKFTSHLDPNLSNVKVDTNQIDQVIMNLVVNGQEAITHQHGVVSLRTSMVEFTGSEIFITGQGEPGRYAKVSVRDNGQGIPRDVLEKIFEPFFTTKKGAGTGLGLSIVYGIIQSNGGHLMVDSTIGKGTEFAFYFPEVNEKIAEENAPNLLERLPSANSSRDGETPTILVAEDQEQVREILELGLGQSGYNLIVAKDGQEAIDRGRAFEGNIDLLLTDSIMPKASGLVVMQELRKMYPNIKVVLMSGLPQQESEEFRDVSVDAYVDKPFSIRTLLELIQEIVSAAR